MRMPSAAVLAVTGLLVLAPLSRADDRDEAALVEAAIKAHGGADALTKAQAFTRKSKGAVTPFGKELAIEEELAVQLPDKLRISVEIAKATKVLIVLNGNKGYESNNGAPTMDLGAVKLKEIEDEAYVVWLSTLLPLKQDGVTLQRMPSKNVNDKPALGLAVTVKDRPDARLYFDKESHLLVKIERVADQGGKKVDKEYIYGDYKTVDGARLPGRVTEYLSGNKLSEITVSSYSLQKPDATLFNKP